MDYENMHTEQYERCPKCNAIESLDAGYLNQSADIVIRLVYCIECEFEYHEVFKFSHNENSYGDILDKNGDQIDIWDTDEFGYFASMLTDEELELSDCQKMLETETKQWKIDLIKEQIRTLS